MARLVRRVAVFEECRFDLASEQLWRGDELVALRPKALALLQLLLEQPGLPRKKTEIFARLWPGVTVTDTVLAVCVNELRAALGDKARDPRYIETLHGRGYRFVAQVCEQPLASNAAEDASRPAAEFVGRRAELGRLISRLDAALRGERSLGLIAGEAGGGKTTLLREFLQHVQRSGDADIALGHCVESFGSGEPYLPLIDALQTLCHGPRGARVRELLQRHAPLWLLQMPGLLSDLEHQQLMARVAGASSQRMLRELGDALLAISRERALVLVCEDLHDSDPSTIAMLGYLMHRRGEGRLLIVGSFRLSASLPLRTTVAELRAAGACDLIDLPPLTLADVASYLRTQLPNGSVPAETARELHLRCAGNPLFMVTIVEHLLRQDLLHRERGVSLLQGDLTQLGVPERLQPLIELQIDRLSPEQREVLEAASVCGQELCVAAVGACLGIEQLSRVEQIFSELAARSSLVRVSGTTRWPDGTVSPRVEFRHVLEREVLYKNLRPARRRLLHRRFGRRLRAAFITEPARVAAELALHFERGERMGPAAELVADAAAHALLRSAQPEALAYTARGFSLLAQAGRFARREHTELRLRLSEGAAQLVLRGFGSAEAERAYRRAHELCDSAGLLSDRAPTLVGLWHFALTRAQYEEAQQIAAELGQLAEAHPQDPVLRLQADNTEKQTRLFRGEPAAVLETTASRLALYDLARDGHLAGVYGADPGVLCHSYMAFGSFLLGRSLAGRAHLAAAQRIADHLELPFAQAQLLFARAIIAQVRGDLGALRQHAHALAVLSEQHNFYQALSFGHLFLAHGQVVAGDVARGLTALENCIDERDRLGLATMMPHALALLAHARARAGLAGDAVTTIERARALAVETGEGWYLAELYRHEAELKHADRRPRNEVLACLQLAQKTARTQQARPFLRRADRSYLVLGARLGSSTSSPASY